MIRLKILLSIIFLVAPLLGCNEDDAEIDVNLSYVKSLGSLDFQVAILSPEKRNIVFFKEVDQSLILGALPYKIEGRSEYVLTGRSGEKEIIEIGPNKPHLISFSGKIEFDNDVFKIDFGSLGFIKLNADNKLYIGAVVFPADLSDLKSDDGYISNYIQVDLGATATIDNPH